MSDSNRSPLWSAVAVCAEAIGWLLSAIFLLGLMAVNSRADESLPLVTESVDEVIAVHIGENSTRLMFVSSGVVIADRQTVNDMEWTASDGEFHLCWEDYCWSSRSSRAKRIVSTARLTEFWIEGDLVIGGERGVWWNQARNMRELRQP